jgi:hypothetical protein
MDQPALFGDVMSVLDHALAECAKVPKPSSSTQPDAKGQVSVLRR